MFTDIDQQRDWACGVHDELQHDVNDTNVIARPQSNGGSQKGIHIKCFFANVWNTGTLQYNVLQHKGMLPISYRKPNHNN